MQRALLMRLGFIPMILAGMFWLGCEGEIKPPDITVGIDEDGNITVGVGEDPTDTGGTTTPGTTTPPVSCPAGDLRLDIIGTPDPCVFEAELADPEYENCTLNGFKIVLSDPDGVFQGVVKTTSSNPQTWGDVAQEDRPQGGEVGSSSGCSVEGCAFGYYTLELVVDDPSFSCTNVTILEFELTLG